MKLESFQVWNFRSINDSGPIEVSRITAILGRNESGKSNLLLALKSLNPVEGFIPLNKIKDFPRHRRLEECTDDVPVLTTRWCLSGEEQRHLTSILPRADSVTHVIIGRTYGGERSVVFENLRPIQFSDSEAKTKVKRIAASVKAAAEKLEENPKALLTSAAEVFEQAMLPQSLADVWAAQAKKTFPALRQALASADFELTEKQEATILELEEIADSIPNDKTQQTAARAWAVKSLPLFIYLDEYPEFNGHQNITDYLSRKNQGNQNVADLNFEKMCKVAGLQPKELKDLLDQDGHEIRNQLVNRASAVVTGEIKRLWKDRPLKIRFNLDAQHLDTLISDPNATFDVEVNLDERSRGFKWFFSFYITFAADTNGGSAANAIVLLDEPGLYLHARSQSDLLMHLEKDFDNQVLFTTHSPFMVPTHHLDWVRTVNIAESAGTTVTNDPTGDSRTLFPLQAAIGYDLSQSLFIGPNNLVVEGVTDFWIISAISDYLRDTSRNGLRSEITLTPAGGAQKVSYMVALLTSEELNVVVLLDSEKEAQSTKSELVKAKLIDEKNVVFVSEAFEKSPPHEADIEDLLDPSIYDTLVTESYAKELKGKTLKLNPKLPRIAKRYQTAFEELGMEFHKTRPSKLLLMKMSDSPQSIITEAVRDRFERLFAITNQRFDAHIEKGKNSFK